MEIMKLMDDDENYDKDQRKIFKEWVTAAVVHHGQGRQLLAKQTPTKPVPTASTGNTETGGNKGNS